MNNNPFTENDFLKFFQGFAAKETKEEITKKYIQGLITKEEFIKRMNNAK